MEIDNKHELPGAGRLGPASHALVRSDLLILSIEAMPSYFGRKHICSAWIINMSYNDRNFELA